MSAVSRIAGRSMLRDSVRRLEELRLACGKSDRALSEFRPNTGDPFTDSTEIFRMLMRSCEAAVKERTAVAGTWPPTAESETAKARWNNEVEASFEKLEHKLEEIEAMVGETTARVFRAREKGKPAAQIQALHQIAEERASAAQQCRRLLNQARKHSRMAEEQIALLVPTSNAQARNHRVRAAVEALRIAKRQELHTGTVQTLQQAALSQEASEERPMLATAEETRERFQQIQEQKREMERGLDRLSATIMRIQAQAIDIGEELDTQNRMLDATTRRISDQADNVARLRRAVDTVLKKQSPMNVCINLFCIILILGLIGLALFKFKVIKS